MKKLFLGLFVIKCLSGVLCSDDDLHVKTPYGTYKGHILKSRSGKDIIAFKGIPYAQPPVGPLRFKDPVKMEEREGVFEANKEYACLQMGIKPPAMGKTMGSEDCLYLIVYKPKNPTTKGLLPVYFYIHGGGYFAGSGSEDWNGPRLLLDDNRDMIMVSINYRLGILGFLSANDENLPGNLGLKDQTMALKWVKENIKLFGGDPDAITIGGISAGAASVSHHINSKASRGLFHRAISQSGTADCAWALKTTEDARKIATKIIAYLGCPFEPKELLHCLQELSSETLLQAAENLKVKKTSMIMYLTPVVEKDSPTAFMTRESIKQGSNVPWMNGVTSEEGLLFYQFLGLDNAGYFDLSVLKKNYKKMLPVVAYYGSNLDAMTEQLKNFYFGKKEFSSETAKNFVQLLSDRMFNHGLHVSLKKHQGKSFMYVFGYKGNFSLSFFRPKGLENGVGHGDDIPYLFNVEFEVKVDMKGKDLDVSNTLLDMWYNFIKNGDPTPDTHLWEESQGGVKYLDFSNIEPSMKTNFIQERMDFNDKLLTTFYRHDEL